MIHALETASKCLKSYKSEILLSQGKEKDIEVNAVDLDLGRIHSTILHGNIELLALFKEVNKHYQNSDKCSLVLITLFSQEGGILTVRISFLDNLSSKMSNKKTFFLLLACLFKVVLSFKKDNVDTTNPTIFNGQNSGLFGHSVALSKSDAFVGAPEDENHGNVFKCSLQSENCKKMKSE